MNTNIAKACKKREGFQILSGLKSIPLQNLMLTSLFRLFENCSEQKEFNRPWFSVMAPIILRNLPEIDKNILVFFFLHFIIHSPMAWVSFFSRPASVPYDRRRHSDFQHLIKLSTLFCLDTATLLTPPLKKAHAFQETITPVKHVFRSDLGKRQQSS